MKSSLLRLASISILSPVLHAATISDDWEFTTALYAPLMGLEGDVGVAGLAPAKVDMSFSDILDDLDAGLSGSLEARKGPWSITADAIWLKMSASQQGPASSYIRLSQDQVTASLSAAYEIYGSESSSLDLAAGVMLNSIDADLDLFTPRLPVQARSGSGSQEWLDPFLALRFRQEIGACWTFFANGAYGGFEVSSDEYWQAVVGLGYRLSESTTLALAYRVISVDYHQGGFVYDTETSGPNIGLIIRF